MIIKSEIQEYEEENCSQYIWYDLDGIEKGGFLLKDSVIHSVLIYEEFQKQGNCGKMFLEIFSEFPREKYCLLVAETNNPARKAYEEIGFIYTKNTLSYLDEKDGYLQMEMSYLTEKNGYLQMEIYFPIILGESL